MNEASRNCRDTFAVSSRRVILLPSPAAPAPGVNGNTATSPTGTGQTGQVAGAHASSGQTAPAPATPSRQNPSCAQNSAFQRTPVLELTSAPVAAGVLPSTGLGLILGILMGLAILAVGSGMRSVLAKR